MWSCVSNLVAAVCKNRFGGQQGLSNARGECLGAAWQKYTHKYTHTSAVWNQGSNVCASIPTHMGWEGTGKLT